MTKVKRSKRQNQAFPGAVVDIKDPGELDVSDNRGIIEFSEELSDGGERDEYIESQQHENEKRP